MQPHFPLFRSHLDLAHYYWERLLKPTDWAIDATCGNGFDTLKLAQLLPKGGVISLDIQESALANAKSLLEAQLQKEDLARVHFYLQSHVEFPTLAKEKPIQLIVYNLGYLPKGNKQLTTMTDNTLVSVTKALDLIGPGGVISITCYPGHEEGAREGKALVEWASLLSPSEWSVCIHTFPQRPQAPRLILIQKHFVVN